MVEIVEYQHIIDEIVFILFKKGYVFLYHLCKVLPPFSTLK